MTPDDLYHQSLNESERNREDATPARPQSGAAVRVKPLEWAAPERDYGSGELTWMSTIVPRIGLFVINERTPRYHYQLHGIGSQKSSHPTLAAAQEAAQEEWATFIRAALEPSNAIEDAIKIMTRMDDLGESMAMGIEDHVAQHWSKPMSELKDPLAQWRAFRPTRGLA